MENRSRINKESLRILFFILVLVIGLWVLFALPRIAIPFGIAYVLFLVLSPIIPYVMKFRFSHTQAVVLLFTAFLLVVTYPIVRLIPLAVEEADNFQYYIPQIESVTWSTYKNFTHEVETRTGYQISDRHLSDLINATKDFSKHALVNIPKIIASIFEWLFVVPLILFFMLKDGYTFRKFILKITPNSIFERFYFLFHQINRRFGDYLFAKFIEAAIIGILITVGLLFAGIKFAVLFGLLAAITNIIPYVGPIIGALPAIAWVLSEYGMGTDSLIVIIIFTVANVLDLALVFPLLVSKIVDMHPIVVVISVILGSQFLGLTGMIISIPAAAALKLIFIEIYNSLYSGQR